MSVTNGIVSAPVSIYDIQHVLGNGSSDLGTLCRASQINKWAKYKPERLNKIGIITHAERRAHMFGFTKYAQPYNETSLLNPAKNYGQYWGYSKPRGGDSNEPYRLTDFVKNPSDQQQTNQLGRLSSFRCCADDERLAERDVVLPWRILFDKQG